MALFRTPLCIFITNSQPSAYLHFAAAPPLLHHSILSHLYSESSLPLVILHPSISPHFPLLCLSIGSLSCSSCSSVLRSLFSVLHPCRGVLTLGRRSARWAVMLILSVDSNGLRGSECGDARETPSLFTHAKASHIQSHTSAGIGSNF